MGKEILQESAVQAVNPTAGEVGEPTIELVTQDPNSAANCMPDLPCMPAGRPPQPCNPSLPPPPCYPTR